MSNIQRYELPEGMSMLPLTAMAYILLTMYAMVIYWTSTEFLFTIAGERSYQYAPAIIWAGVFLSNVMTIQNMRYRRGIVDA